MMKCMYDHIAPRYTVGAMGTCYYVVGNICHNLSFHLIIIVSSFETFVTIRCILLFTLHTDNTFCTMDNTKTMFAGAVPICLTVYSNY